MANEENLAAMMAVEVAIATAGASWARAILAATVRLARLAGCSEAGDVAVAASVVMVHAT